MAMEIRELHPTLAIEIRGADFSPADRPQAQAELEEAIGGRGVVVFRSPAPLDDETHVAFSQLFGPVEIGPSFKIAGGQKPRIAHRAIVDVGNLGPDGRIMGPTNRQRLFAKGNQLWHTDMSFMTNRATYSLLSAHEIPPAGGDTEFADMVAAYEALPEDMKELIDSLEAEHLIWHSRRLAGFPAPTPEELASIEPAFHKLVHTHARTGRRVLYIGAHARTIVGWSEAKATELLDHLLDFATQERFVYRHKWRVGDLVMWDNLATLHRGRQFADTQYRRDMRRTTCREFPAETFEGANA